MKINVWLFLLFLALSIFPVLCRANTVILSREFPDHIAASGSDEKVYGTNATNTITIESGAKVEIINFPGQNLIRIQSRSSLFTVSRSGTMVNFTGSDGTMLKIPATKEVQTIFFNDEESRVLHIHNNRVMLDDQEITTAHAPVEGGACGAYIAPGVWKEFDCYNLAAIGKTTDDDPFTPSWRLIGGYWQWGRKGPDPGQWYDTSTEHFAHGPTGPGAEEANEGEISGWDSIYAPDGAWTDSEKSENDPCPQGFRVPAISTWEGVLNSGINPQRIVGTWSSLTDTNYTSARFFGEKLMLPAAGYRDQTGVLWFRGSDGYYWSSSEADGSRPYIQFSDPEWWFETIEGGRSSAGFSVRCITEPSDNDPCFYSLSFTTASIGAVGVNFPVTVTASRQNCAWITENSLSWVSLSPADGIGSGEVILSVTANSGAARSGTISIAGEPFTIHQDAAGSGTPCGAFIAPGVWKQFDCYNLAAIGKTTDDDPFNPSWRLIGGYWQWGRKGPDPGQWYDTSTEHFAHGPTGPGVGEANDGEINGWDPTPLPGEEEGWSEGWSYNLGSSDINKTNDDPCPEGYKVPTDTQWDGVSNNNSQIAVGTWSSGATNYTSARYFGNDLMLPAAGLRYNVSGKVLSRGTFGFYWSSSAGVSFIGWVPHIEGFYLFFDDSSSFTGGYNLSMGMSVRCIAE